MLHVPILFAVMIKSLCSIIPSMVFFEEFIITVPEMNVEFLSLPL